MITHKSFPQLEKTKIFNTDANLIIVFTRFGLLCQCISFFSEGYGVYGFLFENLPELSYHAKLGVSIGVSLVVALLIEILTYQLVTYCTKSFFTDYFQFKKSTLIEWIKVLIPLVCLFALIYFSMIVSKKNIQFALSANVVEDVYDLEHFDNRIDSKELEIKDQYAADRDDAENSYKERKSLTENSYQSKLDALNGELGLVERKEVRTGLSYTTRKQTVRNQINEQLQKQANELKSLKEKFDTDLGVLKSNRDAAVVAIQESLKRDKLKTEVRNDKVLKAKEARNEWLGYFLRQLAGLSVIGFCIARFWVVISCITTGIEEKNYFKPSFFQSGIIRDFALLSFTFITRKPHNWIRQKLATFSPLIEFEDRGAVLSVNSSSSKMIYTPPTVPDVEDIVLNYKENQKEGQDNTDGHEVFASVNGHKNGILSPNSPAKRIKNLINKVHISTAVLDNDRQKEKHKAKQRKRIKKYYHNYIKKHDKKPTYQDIADALNIALRSVGEYMRYMKKNGELDTK